MSTKTLRTSIPNIRITELATGIVEDADGKKDTQQQLSTIRLLLLGSTLLTVGTMGFYYLPGMLKEEEEEEEDGEDVANGSRLVDSFYCAVMSLATVGYGDVCPADPTVEGKLFLILLLYTGLGIFCGPVMSLASSWQRHVPGGMSTLATLTVGLGAVIFTTFEGLSQVDAIYASVIAGTTVGYGDKTPSSDLGKILVSLYVIMAIPVFGILLEPARDYLQQLCTVRKSQQLPFKEE